MFDRGLLVMAHYTADRAWPVRLPRSTRIQHVSCGLSTCSLNLIRSLNRHDDEPRWRRPAFGTGIIRVVPGWIVI